MTDDPSTNSGEWVCRWMLATPATACTAERPHTAAPVWGCGYVTPSPVQDSEQPDTAMLRTQAEAAAARLAEPCSGCDDTGWSVDENWSPEYPEHGGERSEGDGLTPCGFCNGGNWDRYRDEFSADKSWEGRRDWVVSEFIDACSPAVVLALLDLIDAHRCPTPEGDVLAELRAAWETTQGAGRTVLILDAVDRLLASHPGGEAV